MILFIARQLLLPALLLVLISMPGGLTAVHAYNAVIIDAGHGGKDRGGISGQRIAEKDCTLDVALRLGPLLKKMGYRVHFTRTTDVFVDLEDRASFGNSIPNSVFVSIHFDSINDSSKDGITIFYMGEESQTYASYVHTRMMEALAPRTDRGLKPARWRVLRKVKGPSILIEGGFLTNPTEAARIMKPAYRQAMAEAIAKGIQDFCRNAR
ncbi:MAG TPA: N-acetylmuramoyl-L-alanine amidase [Candidatus Methylacidiphilales bacterium]|nr:N-acetylmuramoyl-L-alanine amidase [Candidatus Methylacidiphilales bacterium]